MPARREQWDRLAATWYEAGPPATPSHHDLDLYLTTSSSTKPRHVVILGCTPSLRRLYGTALNQAPRLTLVDFCPRMHAVTTSTLQPTWVERFIQADWRSDWPEQSGPADIVAGDRALDNVPIADRPAFFSKIRACLRAGGLCIMHTATPIPRARARTPLAWVDHWSREWLSGRGLVECVDGLWDDLLSVSSSPDTGDAVLSVSNILPELSSLAKYPAPDHHQSAQARIVAALLDRYSKAIDAEWYSEPVERLVKYAGKGLVLENVLHASDYPAAEHHPFLVFRAI